jgi:hypothetical protein
MTSPQAGKLSGEKRLHIVEGRFFTGFRKTDFAFLPEGTAFSLPLKTQKRRFLVP